MRSRAYSFTKRTQTKLLIINYKLKWHNFSLLRAYVVSALYGPLKFISCNQGFKRPYFFCEKVKLKRKRFMDRVIEKKKWSTKRILTIAGITSLFLLIFASFYLSSGKSKLNVNTERITISEVKKGPFREFIPVNGIVLPMTSIYLDAQEGGRMEEKYV